MSVIDRLDEPDKTLGIIADVLDRAIKRLDDLTWTTEDEREAIYALDRALYVTDVLNRANKEAKDGENKKVG